MIVEGTSRPGDRPDEARTEPPVRFSLAEIRKDMTDIFGDPGPAAAAATPRTMEVPVKGSTIPSAPVARRRTGVGPLLAAATAGLLTGMAAIGGFLLSDPRGRPIPASTPATGVAENPFERAVERHVVPPKAKVTVAPAPPATKVADRAEPPRQPAKSETTARSETRKPRPAADQPGDATASTAACAGDRLERAWCMRPDILEADRRLRHAYAEAIRQGVERRFLVEHQRRWARLRNLASRDPRGVLEGYGELARDLDRLSIHGRAANRVP
jgi:hypothetical protein